MGEIYSWVKNIVIFLVLTTIITNLLGKSSYKKYVTLITGIILVILVISPLLKLFQLNETLDYYFTNNSLLAEAEDINDKLVGAEESQKGVIFNEYKAEIGKQVGNLLEKEDLYLVSCDATVDEDENSDAYGNILSLTVVASYIRSESDETSSEIKDIKIEDIKIGEEINEKGEAQNNSHSNTKGGTLSPSEINAKNLLSDFYNMNPDNINISIQEQ
jgi:stage III sporulation protein AF